MSSLRLPLKTKVAVQGGEVGSGSEQAGGEKLYPRCQRMLSKSKETLLLLSASFAVSFALSPSLLSELHV